MNEPRVLLANVADVDRIWPNIAPVILPAVERDNHNWTAWQFHTLCRSGQGFLFYREDFGAVAIVTAENIKGRNVGKVQLLAAKPGVKKWRGQMYRAVCQIAKMNGCTGMIAGGRKGMENLFPNARILEVIYEAEI